MVSKKQFAQLLFLFTYIPFISAEYTPVKATDYDSFAYAQEIMQIEHAALDTIQDSLLYWESLAHSPVTFLLSKSPIHWIKGDERSIIIKEKCAALKKMRSEIATDLAELSSILWILEQPEESDTDTNAHKNAIISLEQSVKRIIHTESTIKKSIITYKKSLDERLNHIKTPSHFIRNWLSYSIATVGMISAALYYFENKDMLASKAYQINISAHDAANSFYANHIRAPLEFMKEVFFSPKRQSYENLKAETESLKTMVRDYLNETRGQNRPEGYFWSNNKPYYQRLTPQEIEIEVKKAAIGDLGFVHEDLAREAIHSNTNLITGYTLRLYKILFQNQVVLKTDLEAKIDGMKAVLMAAPPLLIAGTAAGTGILALKLYRSLFNKQSIQQNKLKKILLDSGRILNAESSRSTLSESAQGLIIHNIYILKNHVGLLPYQDRQPFLEDIKELVNFEFTIEQKLRTVDRILKTYEFLFNHAVL